MSPELFASIIGAVVGGVVGVLGACFGAWFTLWLQSRSERIKVLEGGTIYVEFSALKKDTQGYFIPGQGRLIVESEPSGANVPLDQRPDIKQHRGKVALICYNRTRVRSNVPEFGIKRIVPL